MEIRPDKLSRCLIYDLSGDFGHCVIITLQDGLQRDAVTERV